MPELRTILPGCFTAMLALLASAVGALAAAPAEPINSFKDWTVVCDNLRNCEADGFAADESKRPRSCG